jgi:hypothetical protein
MSDGPTFARIDQGSNNNNNNNNNTDNDTNNNDTNNNNDDTNTGNDPDGVNFDPWVTANAGIANEFTNTEGWRERERRQRSVRSFMMFFLMMMLMDGEEQAQERRQRQQQLRAGGGLRGGGNRHNTKNIDNINTVEDDMELYRARRTLDRSIKEIVLNGNHSRINRLVQRNDGNDFDRQIRDWAETQRNIQKREFYEHLLKDLVLEQPDGSYVKVLVASASNNEAVTVANDPSKILLDAVSTTKTNNINGANTKPADNVKDAMKQFDEFLDAEQEVWHYPWNATGFYRGDWKIIEKASSSPQDDRKHNNNLSSTLTRSQNTSHAEAVFLSPLEAEIPLLKHLQNQADPSMGVHILPPGMELVRSTDNRTINRSNPTSGDRKESAATEISGRRTNGNTDHASVNNLIMNNGAFSLRGASDAMTPYSLLPEKLSLTRTSGKIAFQLYSKAVPAMKELTLIDGFVKVFDSNAVVGYSTRKDILLRVRGVMIHSLGRLSLVANPRSTGRSALLVNDIPIGTPPLTTSAKQQNKERERTAKDSANAESENESEDRRRRLKELLSLTSEEEEQIVDETQIEEIRNHALKIFGTNNDNSELDLSSYTRIQSMPDEESTINQDLQQEYILSQRMLEMQDKVINDSAHVMEKLEERRRLEKDSLSEDSETNVVVGKEDVDGHPAINKNEIMIDSNTADKTPNLIYSKHVVPYPFAWDDQEQSLQRNRSPGSFGSISPSEKSLEINAGSCEFEINMYVEEEKWTVGQWKKLMSKHTEHELADASLATKINDFSSTTASSAEKSREDVQRNRLYKKSSDSSSSSKLQKRAMMEQAWVMTLNGTIVSPNCNFEASVNSTAIRTDWETTTGKAMNYSFYMMTICLTQIVLLLRQLLHTQTQSASARVSLLCIGWQTVIDSLLCLVHIYFSLAMQPLFSAFASVAFFKLLIFCVIEMKYMKIIIQARNASNGGNSVELLRRQTAMLHLRFYVALVGSCIGFTYSNDYRTLYMLLLYSFWIPQIVHNVVTETKKSMHPYYICGMSVTRLFVPLYMFANEGNFLKQVYPESPINVFMCQLLILWVGIQTGVLYAQSHFGARFFIPAQFLPPKYDYNRPIPASLLPQDNIIANPTGQLQNERELPKTEVRSLVVPSRDLKSRGGNARNRKEGKRLKGETVMTAETVTEVPTSSGAPCVECVICYNDIDTSDRTEYMIAPCNHIFHKDCLIQWMEVKMECPICRHNLPAL